MALKIVGIGGTNRSQSHSYLALEIALQEVEQLGAEVQAFKVYDLQLPMYDPSTSLNDYGDNVRMFVDAVKSADGIILSSASYHGILAGITKNAIDFLDFTDDAERPYLQNCAVGLIATGASEHGASTTIDSMVSMVHALRGIVVPTVVSIDRAWERFDKHTIKDPKLEKRLKQVAHETVSLAARLSSLE